MSYRITITTPLWEQEFIRGTLAEAQFKARDEIDAASRRQPNSRYSHSVREALRLPADGATIEVPGTTIKVVPA